MKRTVLIITSIAATTIVAVAFLAWLLVAPAFLQLNKSTAPDDSNNAIKPPERTNSSINGSSCTGPEAGVPTAIDEPNPDLRDPNLRAEVFVNGLASPTSMAFVDDCNLLVLEKNNGSVRLVKNGSLQEEPIHRLVISNESERGLLGIAAVSLLDNATRDRPMKSEDSIQKSANSGANASETISTPNAPPTTFVFLYATEKNDQGDVRNKVFRYLWQNDSLVSQKMILDLPGTPGPNHDGGKMTIGPDGNLYVVIGDLNRDGMLQNFPDGNPPDDTSVILRVDLNGSAPPLPQSISDQRFNSQLAKYYAYGVRNSFGLDFDPITETLWATDNGPDSYDEINVVKPGFNGGWQTIMGPLSRSQGRSSELVNFNGSYYSDPVFSWREAIGVTDIEFLNSANLGKEYRGNIFVGDINNGNLYFFQVNENRTGIVSSKIPDLVSDNSEELSSITVGSGFDGITDIETGPDGSLYVLSFGAGKIYRIDAAN